MKLHRLLAALVALALLCAGAASAQTAGTASESAVKAAFLYKFGGFVDWPATTFARPDEPFVIGVAADDALAADLEQLGSGLQVQGRPLQVTRVRDAQAVAGVQILFIGAAARDNRLRDVLPPPGVPVLVVTQQEGGLRLGAAINFINDNGRLRFTAAPAAAEARGLRLSSRLLDVAQSVEGRSR